MKSPLVSVYIPTHNRAYLIERAVSSVLNQTYPNIEIIVVDDGSSDKTPEVLKRLSERHENIHIFRHESPKGACSARNLAIANANGTFITGLDDDDIFLPNRVEDFLTYNDPNYSFICSSTLIKSASSTSKTIHSPAIISFQDIKNKNHVGNQIFIERSRLTESLRYSEKMPAWQDYDLWFRLIKHYGTAMKIDNHSYQVDLFTAQNRISKSSNAYKGFRMFVELHEKDLTQKQIKNHAVNDLYNRGVKLSLFQSSKYACSIYAVKKLISLYILTHWPKVYNLLVDVAVKVSRK